jgi:hypothetical protein
MVCFRLGQVATIGSFILNLVGAAMVLQIGARRPPPPPPPPPSRPRCSLHLGVLACGPGKNWVCVGGGWGSAVLWLTGQRHLPPPPRLCTADTSNTNCSQPLWVTMYAFVLAWLASVVIMPIVYWRAAFDMVLRDPQLPSQPV